MTAVPERKSHLTGVDSIDLMKWICSIMVVVIHCKPLLPYSELLNALSAEGVCRIAVPFFFTTSGLLLCNKLSMQAGNPDKQRFICRKSQLANAKLYLCWSAVYWVYSIPQWYMKHLLTWDHFLDQFRLALIDTGSYYHFWYLVALIYAIPVMRLLTRCKTSTLVWVILLLWPIQCLRYSYRWLPGGDILPWDSQYFDAIMNTLFCAVPLLSLSVLCFQYYKICRAKRWAQWMLLFGVLEISELMLLYVFSPNKNHFEFLLTMPFFTFCLLNYLLSIDWSFSDRRIPLVLRQASTWIYCIHPMIIGVYGYVHNSMGVRRFWVVLAVCLFTSLIYVWFNQRKRKIVIH